MEKSEVKVASEIRELKFLAMIFKGIRDSELGKLSLTALHSVLVKLNDKGLELLK
jgi:hypothetical protein